MKNIEALNEEILRKQNENRLEQETKDRHAEMIDGLKEAVADFKRVFKDSLVVNVDNFPKEEDSIYVKNLSEIVIPETVRIENLDKIILK